MCIARMLALEPEIIMLDEPWFRLGPHFHGQHRKSLMTLKEKYTISWSP